MLYVIIAMAGITGYLALRSPFPLFKLGASIPWIALLAYIAMNYSGEAWNVIAILGCIVMACVFMLSGLGRDIRKTKNLSNGFETEEHESFGLKMPEWLTGKEESPEFKKHEREERNNSYRAELQAAYRRGKANNRTRK